MQLIKKQFFGHTRVTLSEIEVGGLFRYTDGRVAVVYDRSPLIRPPVPPTANFQLIRCTKVNFEDGECAAFLLDLPGENPPVEYLCTISIFEHLRSEKESGRVVGDLRLEAGLPLSKITSELEDKRGC